MIRHMRHPLKACRIGDRLFPSAMPANRLPLFEPVALGERYGFHPQPQIPGTETPVRPAPTATEENQMQQSAPPSKPLQFKVTPTRIAILTSCFALFSLGGYVNEKGLVAWPSGNPVESKPSSADEKLDKILSQLASQRDCDNECLADLRTSASKAAALEDALTAMQADKLTLENRLNDLGNSMTDERNEFAKKLGEAERKTADSRAYYETEIARLKKSLADRVAQPADRIPSNKSVAKLEKPAFGAQRGSRASSPQAEAIEKPLDTKSHERWRVIGMTATTAVISTPKRVVALTAGESADGLTIEKIDMDSGTVQTSEGTLAFRR
jgi:hypothetical protein